MRVLPVIICLLCLPLAFAAADTLTVARIDFDGAVHLPRVAVANAAGVKVVNGRMVCDPVRLQQVLKNEPLVADFALRQEGDVLRVSVTEKKPLLAVGLCTPRQTRIAELDDELNVIALDRMYAPQNPLILFGEHHIEDGRLRPEGWHAVRQVAGWRADTALWNRLRTVDLRQPAAPVFSFSGSGAAVILPALPAHTAQLRACVNALDGAGADVRRLDFFGSLAVIR